MDNMPTISAADAAAQGATLVPDDPITTDMPTISQAQLAQMHPSDVTFVPEDVLRQKKYGTIPEIAKTLAEQTASGATLGASELAEQGALGNAAEREQRAQANPLTAMAGQALGFGAAHLVGAGELEDVAAGTAKAASLLNPLHALEAAGQAVGSIAEKAGASKAAQSALSGAATFGGMGAIQGVNHEVALGDPNLNAAKLISAAGMGALYAAPLGAAGGILKGYLSPSLTKAAESGVETGEGALAGTNEVPMGAEQAQAGVEAAGAGAGDAGGPPPAMASETPESNGMPKQAALIDATSRVPDLENPITQAQIASLDNPANEALYQNRREMPGDLGDGIRNTELAQKNELTQKTDQTIKDIAPHAELTSDAVEGGDKSTQLFTDQYNKTRAELEPLMDNMNATPVNGLSHLQNVISAISEKLPQIGNMFKDASMEEIKPYKTNMGIDKAVYIAIRDAVASLKDNPETFRTLMDIRDGMTQNIDKFAAGKGPAQIRSAQAGFMDYMNSLAAEHGQPLIDVNGQEVTPREVFKRWAQMEGKREVIQKNFGSSVGKQEFGEVSKIKPEDINDKIFRNTANVKAAKNILSPQDFREVLANWLTEKRSNFTDNGVFSSNKWRSFLFKNQDALNEAFKDQPEALQRIKDLNTISRIVPDAPSINPSGSAKTLAYHAKDVFSEPLAWLHPVEAATSIIGKTVYDTLKEARADAAFNKMAGNAAKASVFDVVTDRLGGISEKINNAAKSVFGGSQGTAVDASAWGLSSYAKNSARVQQLANDPHALMDASTQATAFMHNVAPQISQQIQQHMVNGVQFLNSKIPRPLNPQFLDEGWEPSKAQKSKFNEYYRTVDDPVSSLRQIKNGGLTNENMEALQTVYPTLLDHLRMQVMENMDTVKASKMPYASQIALSKFLGQPLSVGLMPQSVIANQAALQPQPPASPPQGKGKKGRGSSAKNLALADRAATGTSREEAES